MPQTKEERTSKTGEISHSQQGILDNARTKVGKIVRFAYSQLDLFLTIILAGMAWREVMPAAAAGPVILSPLSLLDHSWALEFAFKANHGILLGRDTAFTYGPLYQWLWSLPSRIAGFSLGSFFATHELFQLWMILALTYASSALLLHGYAPWKRALYLFLIVGFWEPLEVRSAFVLFVLACIVYQMQHATEATTRPILRPVITSLVVIISFLISADSGIYACAIFTVTGIVNLVFLYRNKDKLWRFAQFLLFAVFSGALWAFAVNAFMRGPLYFGFWQGSLEMANNYRWAMAGEMVKQSYHRVLAYIIFGICAFIFAWIWRRRGASAVIQHPASLLSTLLGSLLVLQSGIVRSDWGHVLMGVFPLIAIGFAMLMGDPNQSEYKLTGDIPVLLVIVLTGIFSGPNWYVQPSRWANVFRSTAKTGCPADRIEFDHACIVQQDYDKLAPVTDYLTKHTSDRDRIIVFPYENIYGDVSRRIVSGGVLQPYAAAGSYLVKRELEGMEADKPPVAIYSADDVATGGVDGVPNFTRSPEVWFYLQSHYQLDTEIQNGVLALHRNQERMQRWNMHAQSLVSYPIVQKIKMNNDLTLARSLSWPADADFLILRMKVQYPFWWKFSKPARTLIELRRQDGSYARFPILVNPNQSNEIWIYPWDQKQLSCYFASDAGTWRTGARSPIVDIRLRFEPIDFISAAPSRMIVEDLSIVSLTLK